MKKRTKIGLILELAYLIDRISYPDKYKKKELELAGELKYTTASGEVKREKINFDIVDKLKYEKVGTDTHFSVGEPVLMRQEERKKAQLL